ncbi:tetratricopeptide repeat protein [Acidicapsa dinghuensis]|uniref:Tetratricopeptide repeat protein n=1 Tax=Acidicapsa dinghuensis TaxID=2218256 RepID=A0ABW1EII4_9BACT|nr:tetratricopeptide repeat protein [Acidicapsa dinghuensis]
MASPVSRRIKSLAAVLVLAAGVGLALWAQGTQADSFETLLHRGFDFHQQARFGEAIQVLNQARELEPNDYFANLLLGIDLLRIGKPLDAIPRLQSAARTKPEEEFPEDYLGEAEATVGRYGLAAEAFERAVQRGHGSEQSIEAWAGFALERFHSIGLQLRTSEEGLSVARRLESTAKTREQVAANDKSCSVAIPLLEKRFANDSQKLDADAAYRLSICYAFEAGEAAGRLGNSAEDLAAVHELRGDVLLRLSNDPDGAEKEYRQAISLHPRDPRLLERLAEAQLSKGDSDNAKASAQVALVLDPHRQSALRTLAAIAMNERDYENALPLLRQLTAQTPNDKSISIELGRALAETGDDSSALKLLEPALREGYPDEKGSLHALLARVLKRLGRDTDAGRAAAEARRLSDQFQAHSAQRESQDAAKDKETTKPDAN